MFPDAWLLAQPLWNAPLLAVCFGTFGIYLFVVKYVAELKIWDKQPLTFFCGITLLYVIAGSPFAPLSHLSFSLHMVQMGLLFFIVPPLLLNGVPELFWRKGGTVPIFQSIPSSAALYAFAVLFLLYHIPAVMTFLSRNSLIYDSYFFLLLLLSFWMWCPLAAFGYFNQSQRNRYAYLSGAVLMPACLLFIVSAVLGGTNNPFMDQITATLCMDPSFIHTGLLLPFPFNTRWDQLLAGFLMLILHKLGLVLTFRLGRKEPVKDF